jgi:LCP family protein required for cell wall assembly
MPFGYGYADPRHFRGDVFRRNTYCCFLFPPVGGYVPVRDYARTRRARRRTSPGAKSILAIVLVAFVAGGLYSGYVFYSTLKAAVMQPPSWSLLSIPDGAPGSTQIGSDPVVTTATNSSPVWTGQERVNVLLLGVDQREDERGQPTRTDTMIVLTLDPVSKSAGMLSIPRDLWVAIPLKEVGEERINAAHFFGDSYKYPGGGPALAKKTVSLNLGIPIHFYARVDFQGFERVVNSIGGINIDVPTPLRDDQYPDGNYGTIRVFIPAGLQHMDGQTALIYSRSRHSDSDFGRIKRQQQVLLALREQGLQLGLLPKLPFLFTTLKDAVTTDIPAKEALVLAQLAAQIDMKNIVSRSIDANMVTEYVTPGGADVVVPKREEIKTMIQEMFYRPKAPAPTAVPPTPTASAVEDKQKLKDDAAKIEVQNGTDVEGLAAKAKAALDLRGYQVVSVANAELSNYQDTVLIYYSDTKRYTRDQLVRFFGVSPANLRNGNNPRSEVDFRVILGASAKIP